jgi:hypothetical protein
MTNEAFLPIIHPARKRLEELIKEAQNSPKFDFKSILDKVRKRIKERETQVLKLIEEFERNHGKLQFVFL